MTLSPRRQPQHNSPENQPRRGAVVPLIALLLIPLMGMVAFAIDYGHLALVRADMQRAADSGVLAAVMDLVPNPDGTQNVEQVKQRLRDYVNFNLGSINSSGNATTFNILDADIEIGRYDADTIYSDNIVLHNDGLRDTVRVTLRRDNQANPSVSLFFAKALGYSQQSVTVTATAVLRRAEAIKPEADVLPFALPVSFWNSLAPGSGLAIYDDNSIIDDRGQRVPGNWGTVDLGYENNSTHDLNGQIINGLRAADAQQLYLEGRIATPSEVRTPLNVQAETGLSIGMKSAVRAIHGQHRIIPLYDSVNGDFLNSSNSGTGNNAEFHIVAWGVVQVTDSEWNGNRRTHIHAIKSYTYDGALVPREDLSDKGTDAHNVFASPVLVR